jgi:Gas vesicle synthesis protein GvpL/GvpF
MANRGIAAEPALYLYGISRPARSKMPKIANTGIDGVHPVKSMACGEFVCWVSAVDSKGFSEEIERNMENLEWLALHGVRHQQVVGEIAAKETIIPARFGTIFSGASALLKNVQGRKSALEKVLSRISDADEWGIKVFSEPLPGPAIPEEVRSGKDYLKHKAARMKRRPERDDSGLKEFAREMQKIAIDSAPAGKISGVQPDLLWQATFLVPRSRWERWDEALEEYVRKWAGSRRIEVNGPWPPYSFVSDAE